jgi:hypothetical protein
LAEVASALLPLSLQTIVLVLLNLMKADGNSNEKEKEYIKQIIENFDFGFYTKSKFRLDLELPIVANRLHRWLFLPLCL